MACVVWLSPLEAIQWRAQVTASTSIVKLEAETIQAALSSWMVASPCLTVTPHPDWSFVTESSVYIMKSCGLLFSWMRSLVSDCFAWWPLSMVLSQVFWQVCLTETWELVGYLSHSLACLSSVSWHTCSTETSAWPIQDLLHPSLHLFVSFTAFWSGLWGFPTALKYASTVSIIHQTLTITTGCLTCMSSFCVCVYTQGTLRELFVVCTDFDFGEVCCESKA